VCRFASFPICNIISNTAAARRRRERRGERREERGEVGRGDEKDR